MSFRIARSGYRRQGLLRRIERRPAGAWQIDIAVPSRRQEHCPTVPARRLVARHLSPARRPPRCLCSRPSSLRWIKLAQGACGGPTSACADRARALHSAREPEWVVGILRGNVQYPSEKAADRPWPEYATFLAVARPEPAGHASHVSPPPRSTITLMLPAVAQVAIGHRSRAGDV